MTGSTAAATTYPSATCADVLGTLGNLFRLYRPLLDTLYFFDNSSDTPRLVFKDESGRTIWPLTTKEQLAADDVQ